MDKATGTPLKNKGRSERSTLTGNGRVCLTRRRWQGTVGGVVPADTLLDAAEATVSLGARELICQVGADSKSFARAAANLKHVGQLPVSAELVRQVAEGEGKRVLLASDSGQLKPGWQAQDCKTLTPEGQELSRVYLGTDGFMVPTLTDAEKKSRRKQVVAVRRKRDKAKPKLPPLLPRRKGTDQRYKEFKLVQFHDETMKHRLVSVTRKDCKEAGRLIRRDAGRIGLARADERLGSIDGGPWILNQIVRCCIALTALCLDFYHLADNVGKSRRIVFGENIEAGKRWAQDLLHTAKHEGYGPFWRKLVGWRAEMGEPPQKPPTPKPAKPAPPGKPAVPGKPALPGKPAPPGEAAVPAEAAGCVKVEKADAKQAEKIAEADRLLHYVAARQSMLNYDRFLAKGWRISCSPTESQCRVIPQRVVGPGKRWDRDNAEAIMALEAMHQGKQWNDYWITCACRNN